MASAGRRHSASAHRGGQVQSRIRRRQALQGKTDPVGGRGNHAWTEDQAGRRKRANIGAAWGCPVHTLWRLFVACSYERVKRRSRGVE